MDLKGLENKIKLLMKKIKGLGPDQIATRDLRKQLKRAQRRVSALKKKRVMIETKAKKKKEKAA